MTEHVSLLIELFFITESNNPKNYYGVDLMSACRIIGSFAGYKEGVRYAPKMLSIFLTARKFSRSSVQLVIVVYK